MDASLDYDLLLEGCCELGCELLACGGEIYRVEDTVHRLLAAYSISGEVFAIPNCLIVSISDGEGRLHTRMHRANAPKNDVALLESFNALSRKLCAAPPKDPGELLRDVWVIKEQNVRFPVWLQVIGYFIGSFFFTFFFDGTLTEALIAGIAGLAAGLINVSLGLKNFNFFITTVLAGFVMAMIVYMPSAMGIAIHLDTAMAGGLMALVPGLVFTNFLSDLLEGDVVAGLSTFVRAMLCALAVALGTCVAMAVFRNVDVALASAPARSLGWLLHCLTAAAACYGFCYPFNIRGRGGLLCALGGGLGWLVYEIMLPAAAGSVLVPSLFSAIAVAVYSEVMARVRKCPASAYLIVSLLPMVPGLAIYKALDFGLRGELELFWQMFFRTFGIAGSLALGHLLVTSCVRLLYPRRRK